MLTIGSQKIVVVVCSNTFLKNKKDLLENLIEILSKRYEEVVMYKESYNSLGKISKIINTNENKIIIFNYGNVISSLSLDNKEEKTEEDILESVSII